jgi:Family of unknown function (DUF5343)
MSTKLPYVAQPGIVKKVLEKARDAKTPDRFTGDFLETKLGCRGGNYRQFIPLAKKLGLLNSDGTPTDIYKAFRNPTTSKASIAEAIKIGYPNNDAGGGGGSFVVEGNTPLVIAGGAGGGGGGSIIDSSAITNLAEVSGILSPDEPYNGEIIITALPPPLSITADGANVVLTWPAADTGFTTTGYTLESATNLVPPVAWQTNSAAPIVIGGQDVVINPITGTQMFFRLTH